MLTSALTFNLQFSSSRYETASTSVHQQVSFVSNKDIPQEDKGPHRPITCNSLYTKITYYQHLPSSTELPGPITYCEIGYMGFNE